MKLLTFLRRAAPAAALVAAGAASAAGAAFDTSSITDTITAVGTAVGVIGAAVCVMHYGAKAWKWIRSAG